MGQTCSDNSYKNFEMMIANTTVDRNATGVGLRQWIYQTCSQFGYCKNADCNITSINCSQLKCYVNQIMKRSFLTVFKHFINKIILMPCLQ